MSIVPARPVASCQLSSKSLVRLFELLDWLLRSWTGKLTAGKVGRMAGLLRTRGAAPAAPHLCYQSNRTVSAMTRGVIVPAASVVPVAVYLPVLALLFTELGRPAEW